MRLHRFAYTFVLAALAACGSVDRPFTDGGGDDVPIDSATAPDAIPQFTVSVVKTGNGTGGITSNPTGLDCGSTCSADFDSGQSVTLTADPDPDSTFVGWTGGGCTGTGTCTFDVTADTDIQAAFALNNSVVVTLGGNGTGQVTSDVAGIDCPGDCDEAYGPGQTVVLTAVATGDSFFDGWSGGGCSGTGTCTVTTDTAVGVTATFTLNQYTLTVNPGGNGTGTITSNPSGINCPGTCSALFDSGTNVVLTATPSAGRFAGWSGGLCAGTSTCSVDMTTDVSVDATFSLIQVIDVSSSTVNGAYTVPASILIQTTFTDPVVVTGTPTLSLNTGGTASYSAGSGTNTLTFTYTVAAGQNTGDLDYSSVNALSLNGGTIKDSVGNNATLTLPTPGAVGSLGANKAIVIDTNAPTVSNVSSTTVNGSYGVGSVVSIQVAFSETVNVTGTPTLTLNSGATVSYTSGTGSTTLTFTYTVAAGNAAADLDYVATSSLSLAGGTIKDVATNNATLTLPTPGAAGSLGANKNIVIDGVAPTVTSVNSTTANGAYGTGSTISIQVTFSESVAVTGTPQLTLNTGATVNYSSGSGTTTLTFTYTVAAGQNTADLDYSATSSLSLNGGTIRDAVNNNATLTLPTPGAAGSLGANRNIIIDTAVPTVTNVTSTTTNGSYPAGTVIPIQVTFGEAVNVTGNPLLAVNTGASVRYVSGSGTATLTFTYTVSPRQYSTDLDYNNAASLTLNGGTIRDAANNNATLTLPTPGAAGSLGANRDIAISAIFVADSVPAQQTFTNQPLASRPCGLAWDGSTFWTCNVGTSGGNVEASYNNAYGFISYYVAGIDFRGMFTKGDGTGTLFARPISSNVIKVQTSPGVWADSTTLSGGTIDGQANIHWDRTNNEFITMNAGVISRWNSAGAFIGTITLNGFGTLNSENTYPQNRGVVWAGGFYLTYSAGVLSAWNSAGTRVDTITLAGAGTSFDSYFSLGYARGMVWIVDANVGTWRGYNVGIEPTAYDPGWSVPGVAYSNANRSISGNTAGTKNARTFAGRTTGKFYWEVTATAGDGAANAGGIGILEAAMPNNAAYIGAVASGLAWGYGSCCVQYWLTWAGATTSGQPPANSNPAPGLVYMFALDMSSGRFWAGQNGTWYNGGDPANNANPAATGITGTVFNGATFYASSIDAFTANFGNAAFAYPPPTGFMAGLY